MRKQPHTHTQDIIIIIIIIFTADTHPSFWTPSRNGSTSQVASPGMDQSYQAELYDSIPNQSYMSAPNSGKMSAPNSGNRFPTEGRSSLPPAPSSGGREVQNLAEQLDEERRCVKLQSAVTSFHIVQLKQVIENHVFEYHKVREST